MPRICFDYLQQNAGAATTLRGRAKHARRQLETCHPLQGSLNAAAIVSTVKPKRIPHPIQPLARNPQQDRRMKIGAGSSLDRHEAAASRAAALSSWKTP
jgi:hypothetical protein